MKHEKGQEVEKALVEVSGALGGTPDLLGTNSKPASTLGKLLAGAVLLDNEEWDGADESDGSKVAEKNSVGEDFLIVLVANARRDTDGNGVGDNDNR